MLLQNAPHVTGNLSFVLPCYSFWQKIFYGIGLGIYDVMAGKLSLGKTKIIDSEKTKEYLPTIDTKNLSGAIVYSDGQFDDARLAINLAQTAAEHNATILNYCKIISLIKENKKVSGVIIKDGPTGKQYEIKSKVVINATGVFADEVLQMDDTTAKKIVSPSQGVHLILHKKFFPGSFAMMIPKTKDGRVLFALPWYNHVVVGTTDTSIESHSLEPRPLEEEIEFIMHHLNRYLDASVKRSDVKAVYAGLRPLVKKGAGNKTSLMPRDHTIIVSISGLVTITGGKWTTYRKMANDVLNKAVLVAKLEKTVCITEHLKIHGWTNETDKNDPLHIYGCNRVHIKSLCKENESWSELIHPSFPNIKAEIIWAVRKEMAVTVEDVLARRTRILFLDAAAAIESVPVVASLMAQELNKDGHWINQQVIEFIALAKQYLLS